MSRVCKKCGGAVKMEDQFCMHCGMPLEKEEPVREDLGKEERQDENKAEVLSMGDYLLMLILLAIPVVNFIVCIIWIISSNGNPNRRNFAKAWLILAVIGTILSGILSFGLFQFFVMDHPVNIHEHIEYSIPEEQFIDNFMTELNEV
ncbi:hypothetical protein [Anaerotignum sp.]